MGEVSNSNFATTGALHNCYQRIDQIGSGGNNLNFLNLNGTVPFWFDRYYDGPGNTLMTHYLRIQVSTDGLLYYDINNAYPGSGEILEDELFSWVYTTNGTPLIEVQKYDVSTGQWRINNNIFYFGDSTNVFTSARITIYGEGQQNLGFPPQEINLINDLEDVWDMSATPTNGDLCLTFDNFSIQSNTILDQLCGAEISISADPLSDINSWLPNDYKYTYSLFNNSKGNSREPQNFPKGEYCNDCYEIDTQYGPNPVPCGCNLFKVEFKLLPCPGSPPECQPITIEKNIEICCKCDIRTSPDLD